MPDDKDYEHEPYMATIQASRVSSNPGAVLFDSETRHGNFITVRISEADRKRDLSHDWIHARREIIEVAMTESQWATFISSLNMGSGTPCTLQHVNHEQVDQPTMPDDKMIQFHDEMMETIQRARDKLAALKEAPGISKARVKEIELIDQELKANTAYVDKSFRAHMHRYIGKAKTEVEAYANAMIQRAGLKALGAPDAGTKKLTFGRKKE